MAAARPNACDMCGRLVDDSEPRAHLCFKCWFTVDQLAFRDWSWQHHQAPLRFSFTRFASTPKHVPARRARVVLRRESIEARPERGPDDTVRAPLFPAPSEPTIVLDLQLALPFRGAA